MLKKVSALVTTTMTSLIVLSHAGLAASFNLTIEGTDAIFLAGRTDLTIPPPSEPWDILGRHLGPTPEELPETLPSFVAVGTGDIITVDTSTTSSGVSFFNGFDFNTYAPSGDFSGTSNLNPLDGISGYQGPLGPLVGVFLNDAIPSRPSAPSTLDFTTDGLGVNFASLAPDLAQVFYIGDGLTDTGEAQQFIAPSSATRLFLGIADGFGFAGDPGAYDDNDGSYQALVEITASSSESVPEPTSFIGLLLFGGLASRVLSRKRAF